MAKSQQEIDADMEKLRQILDAQNARLAISGTWDESKRDNEKHGGIVNKPGEAK